LPGEMAECQRDKRYVRETHGEAQEMFAERAGCAAVEVCERYQNACEV